MECTIPVALSCALHRIINLTYIAKRMYKYHLLVKGRKFRFNGKYRITVKY